MIKRLLYILLSIGVLFALSSCSDEPSSVGADLLNEDLVKVNELNSLTDSVNQNSSFFRRVINTGRQTPYSLIGKHENIEASTLMRFLILPEDSVLEDIRSNQVNVNEAYVEFPIKYTYGDETAPFDFTVHKITSDWSSDFTADSLPGLSYEEENLKSEKTSPNPDSLYLFNLDVDLVLSWLNIRADTSVEAEDGIYMKPVPSTEKVVGFQALLLGAEVFPLLNIIIEKPGVYLDTIRSIPATDISVFTGEIASVGSNVLPVQSGLATNAFLKFDLLNKIPENSLIVRATCNLYLDTLETMVGSGSSNSILTFFVTDSSDLSNIVVDSSTSGIVFSRSGNLLKGDLTRYVQRWIKTGENEGLLLQTGAQTYSVDLYAVYGSNFEDRSLRPRLSIIYTTIK